VAGGGAGRSASDAAFARPASALINSSAGTALFTTIFSKRVLPVSVDKSALYSVIYIRSVPNARSLEVAIWLRIRFRASKAGARCRDPEGKASLGRVTGEPIVHTQ
jgi:hypothetical protein